MAPTYKNIFAFESLPVHMYCHAGYLACEPPNLFQKGLLV